MRENNNLHVYAFNNSTEYKITFIDLIIVIITTEDRSKIVQIIIDL